MLDKIRKHPLLLWAIIVIYPFLFVWQGINFSDEGNALALYQLIFTDPHSIRDTFGTWGAHVIGGVWLKIFGDFGLVGVRIAGVGVSVLTLLVAYFLLREYIPKVQLLFALLLGELLCHHFFSPTILGYNNLSVLFFALAIIALATGLRNDQYGVLILAGFILGINCFVRLPNVLGLSFALAISFNGFLKKISFAEIAKQYAAVISGLMVGWGVSIFGLFLFEHESYFYHSLMYLFESVNAEHGAYNLQGTLLFSIVKGYYILFTDGPFVFLGCLLGVWWFLNFPLPAFLKVGIFISFILSVGIFYDKVGIPIAGRFLSFVILLCLLALAFAVLRSPRETADFSVICLLIFLLASIMPIGSGAGFVNHVYTIPIALPVAFYYLFSIKELTVGCTRLLGGGLQAGSFRLGEATINSARQVFFAGFIAFSLVNSFSFTYDEKVSRFKMTTSIDHKYTRGIYTVSEKAGPLNELLSEVSKYVGRGDQLFVAWVSPMLYYLTETRPFFPHPWSEIYGEDAVRNFFDNPPNGMEFPVVVKASSNKYDSLLQEFLNKERYKRIWENDVYEIYVPPNDVS